VQFVGPLYTFFFCSIPLVVEEFLVEIWILFSHCFIMMRICELCSQYVCSLLIHVCSYRSSRVIYSQLYSGDTFSKDNLQHNLLLWLAPLKSNIFWRMWSISRWSQPIHMPRMRHLINS
jgi:hypothetical protein